MIRGPRYEFVGRAPLSFRIASVLAISVFMALWLLGFTSRWWAPQSADPTRPYAVRFRGGLVYYFRPAVGWFVENGLWLFFALLGVMLLIMWLNRGRVKRVE